MAVPTFKLSLLSCCFTIQSSANIVKQQLSKLSLKVGTAIQPVFVSRKLNEDLEVQEAKPSIPQRFLERFHVLAKCTSKFDCLIHEMLFIRKLKPELNAQTDLIRAKVFV